MRQAKAEHFRFPVGKARKARGSGYAARLRLVIACGLCTWLMASFSLAQVAGQNIWPLGGSGLWYWVIPKTDFIPERVDAVFTKAVAEEMAFLDPGFGATVFFAKGIRLTKGKAKKRKKYQDQPERADDLRIETEWRTGNMNQYRGQSDRSIALDSIRSLDLHYLPNLRGLFPKVPAGRNWQVNMLAGSLYNFFFASEDTARNFINAVASVLTQRGLGLAFSRFGLMWANVTPAQAADLGRPTGESVLITSVAMAGPGDRAGIRSLDVVLEVDGAKVKNFSHFSLLLDGIIPGKKAALCLLRRLEVSNPYQEQYAWNPLTVEMEAR